ncbi:potassium channel family protein [Salinimicrobium catena]|uniref:potassium channel family protein n=1 Tax=Salinimicrobium catena TaxID=390640 RepID=UPI002FE4765C
MDSLQIIGGLVVIALTFLDFFHTTLSGNGFGFISRELNRLLNRLIIRNRNRSIYRYSGLAHLLITTSVWLGLLFCGAFLIFTAKEEMVVNGSTFLPATEDERFYYTSYVLSTLGIGDFVPGSETSRILTGILSFTGFILITTGLTYLLSVVQAVLSKKELAFFISTLGGDVEEIYRFFKKDENLDGLLSDANDLRKQILKNASSYLAFPMTNYFLTKKRNSALIVQLAILSEVLMVLRMDWKEGSLQHAKLCTLINAIEKYLELGLESPDKDLHNQEKLNTLRSFWQKYGHTFKKSTEMDRRFTSSLYYAGWSWKEVYKMKEQL